MDLALPASIQIPLNASVSHGQAQALYVALFGCEVVGEHAIANSLCSAQTPMLPCVPAIARWCKLKRIDGTRVSHNLCLQHRLCNDEQIQAPYLPTPSSPWVHSLAAPRTLDCAIMLAQCSSKALGLRAGLLRRTSAALLCHAAPGGQASVLPCLAALQRGGKRTQSLLVAFQVQPLLVPQHLHPVKVASNAIAQRMRARPTRSAALDSRAHGLGQQSQVPRALPAAMAAATAKHPSRVRQLHSRLQYLKALVPPQGQQQQQQHLRPAVYLSRLPLMTLHMCLVHGASRMARGTVMTKSWSRLLRMRHSCSSSHAQM